MKIYEQNNLFGLKDDNNTIVLPAKFFKDFIEEIKGFSLQELITIRLVDVQYELQPNGMYIFKDENDKWGLKKYNSELIVECKYKFISNFESNGLAVVELNKKQGLINAKGEKVVECKYDCILNFESNGLAVVGLNNKYGFINEKGEVVVECKYSYIYEFQPNGLAEALLNGKWGFINEKGEWFEDENI